MSDTETEMRGLLAAATADMPPMIDLRDGLAGAACGGDWRTTDVGGRAVLSAGVAAVVGRPR